MVTTSTVLFSITSSLMQRVLSLHSVKISSELAGGFMRTCAADCLSTLLTSQMVGWTWARSETASLSLKSLSSVPLTAPRLLLTFCLSYICAVSAASRVLYFCWNDSAQTPPHTHTHIFLYVQFYCHVSSHQPQTLQHMLLFHSPVLLSHQLCLQICEGSSASSQIHIRTWNKIFSRVV